MPRRGAPSIARSDMTTKTNSNNAKKNDNKASTGRSITIERRDHEFAEQRPTLADIAPVGLAPSSPAQVTGATVFDILENLSSVGQVAVLRSLANGAICGAVFAQHQALVDDDAARAEAAQQRAYEQAELYTYLRDELGTMASSRWDAAMTLEEALDFASEQARSREMEDLPDEFLEQLGIDRKQLKLIDAQERLRQSQRDAKLRESVRSRRDAVKAELESYIGSDSSGITSSLTAEQHVSLYQKASRALSKRMAQLIAARGRYDGALAEALLISGDIKEIDKAFKHFRKENAGELRDAA